MAYYEGEINPIGSGGYNNGWAGNDAWWIIILLIFGWGNNFGNGGFGGRGAGSELVGYELGKVATTNDVASGFNNSAVLGGINSIKENQLQMQNFINQGFNGINTGMLQGFHGVDNAICNLGYNLTHQISDCCCRTQASIADLKYANEKQTCDIVQAVNASNQRVIDYMQNEKIDTLNRKLAVAEGQISQASQTATLLSAINRTPVPAYSVPNPYCCYSPCGNTTL